MHYYRPTYYSLEHCCWPKCHFSLFPLIFIRDMTSFDIILQKLIWTFDVKKKDQRQLRRWKYIYMYKKWQKHQTWGYIRSKLSLVLFFSIILVKILRSTYFVYWSKTLYFILFQVSLCKLVNKSSNFSTGSGGSVRLIKKNIKHNFE